MIDWSRRTTEADRLQAVRVAMVCTRLQGRYVLGEAVCDRIDAIAADLSTPWALRQAIDHSLHWYRTSQSMDVMAYLMGFTDERMDALFVAAMGVDL